MKKQGTRASPVEYVLGFTLTELMISLTLGLGLVTLMIDTIANISRAGRVSAEAAEATERAYFMIDVLDAWVSETAPPIHLPWLSMSESEPVNAGVVFKKNKNGGCCLGLERVWRRRCPQKKESASRNGTRNREMVQATRKRWGAREPFIQACLVMIPLQPSIYVNQPAVSIISLKPLGNSRRGSRQLGVHPSALS